MSKEEKYFNSCGCGSANFSNASGSNWENDEDFPNAYLDFEGEVEDGEGEEFDEFLSKKARERRKRMKELQAEGISKMDAKKQALTEIGRSKIGQALHNIIKKKGEEVVIGTAQNEVPIPSDSPVKTETGVDAGTGADTTLEGNGGNVPTKEASAMGKYAMYGVIGVVLAVGGYFAYQKWGKGKAS